MELYNFENNGLIDYGSDRRGLVYRTDDITAIEDCHHYAHIIQEVASDGTVFVDVWVGDGGINHKLE